MWKLGLMRKTNKKVLQIGPRKSERLEMKSRPIIRWFFSLLDLRELHTSPTDPTFWSWEKLEKKPKRKNKKLHVSFTTALQVDAETQLIGVPERDHTGRTRLTSLKVLPGYPLRDKGKNILFFNCFFWKVRLWSEMSESSF